jgi:hypothetical protein
VRRNKLTEEEEVSDNRWQEICRWANDEWVGGGYVGAGGEAVTFYSSSGAMSLKLHAYKHNPEDPRVLYSVDLADGRAQNTFSVILDEKTEVPETLDDFLLTYAEKEKYTGASAYPSTAAAIRALRKRVTAIKAEKGYQSLAEVYAYVIHRLRTPVEHHEVHTDIDFEESVIPGNDSSMNTRNLESIYQWLKELFPSGTTNGEAPNYFSFSNSSSPKLIPSPKGDSYLDVRMAGKGDSASYGTVKWHITTDPHNPKIHFRSLELIFHVKDLQLIWTTLHYSYSGKRYITIRWDKGVPPEHFADFLKQGEALTRARAVTPEDPSRDVNLRIELLPLLVKSPFIKIIAPYYEETMQRLFAPVEHHAVHTDVDYEESTDPRLTIETDLTALGE